MNHEYDIDIDGAGMMVFCISENHWRGSDDCQSEGLCNSGKDLYSFKNGEVWRHNDQGGRNSFYGVPVKSHIGVLVNADGGKVKTYQTVSVESNQPPSLTSFKTTTPGAQLSNMSSGKYQRREGVFYAPILRAGTGAKLLTGNRMRGPYMYCLFEFNTQELLQVRFVNIGYRISAGHEFV